MKPTRIITDSEYQRMVKNGWLVVHEYPCDVSIKLKLEGSYSKVKEYYVTTRIRGYYNTIYMVKR